MSFNSVDVCIVISNKIPRNAVKSMATLVFSKPRDVDVGKFFQATGALSKWHEIGQSTFSKVQITHLMRIKGFLVAHSIVLNQNRVVV